jgi:hypothetical protein
MNEKEREEMKALVASLGLSKTMAEMVETVYQIAFINGRKRDTTKRISALQEILNANK